MAIDLNGTSQRVDVSGFTWPSGGGPVSVSLWNNTPGSATDFVLGVGTYSTSNGFNLSAPWSDNLLYWDYGNNAAGGRITTSYAAYVNKWTHIAVVSEGAGGSYKAIYLDGVLANSDSGSSSGPSSSLSTLCIGAINDPTPRYHDGILDDVRIYNRVLSAEEVATIYSAVQTAGHDGIVNGLVARYTLSEGAPGVAASGAGAIKDIGPNGFDGTPVNSPTWAESELSIRKYYQDDPSPRKRRETWW
jgi:hypothetical protein